MLRVRCCVLFVVTLLAVQLSVERVDAQSNDQQQQQQRQQQQQQQDPLVRAQMAALRRLVVTVLKGIAILTCAGAATKVPPVFLVILGFSPTGVRRGSIASWLQAKSTGGNVVAGGVFAVLQSAGMRGLGRLINLLVVIGGASFAVLQTRHLDRFLQLEP